MSEHKLNTAGTATVDKAYHWRLIDGDTPRGSKVQLIDIAAGVAQYGILDTHNKFGYTHWAPCPTFKKPSEYDLSAAELEALNGAFGPQE